MFQSHKWSPSKKVLLDELHTVAKYRIVGRFGGGKVWRIYSFRAFGENSLVN